jgi:zinc-ribbon family
MIIFGWGRVTKKQHGPTLAMKCPQCNNETWFQLWRYRSWFTLFFIPLIPYSTAHFLSCSVCSQGMELNGDRLQQAKQLNGLTKGLLNATISKDDYRREAKKLTDKITILA